MLRRTPSGFLHIPTVDADTFEYYPPPTLWQFLIFEWEDAGPYKIVVGTTLLFALLACLLSYLIR